jgi:Protein of unknown function (DUF962)
MHSFLEALRTQRWDDHRFYHHSRINQALHLVSAISFVCSYILVFTNPVAAVLLAWLVGMTSRQAGHFFFEPRDYDHINQATHEHKEDVKIGYNLRRKVVLMGIWALSPLALYFDPTLFGIFEPHADIPTFVHHVALMWITIGIGGLIFRTVHLFFIKDVQTGLVWATKIITDPFHDIKLYHRAPYYLLKGQLIDPHTNDEELFDDEEAEEAPRAS